jgi:hypothetical protein
MEWISVKDELPIVNIEDGDFKTSKKVIAFFRNKEHYWCESVTLKLWCEDDEPEWYYDYDSEIVTGNKITHWMPLPKPPKP